MAMQSAARVRLQWLTPGEGGRSRPFIGGRYTPTARFPTENEQFSVVLRFANGNQPNPGEGILQLLVPDLDEFQARITSGGQLEIMEGARKVAQCEIASVFEEIPGEVLSH
jgi:hypothetical protein